MKHWYPVGHDLLTFKSGTKLTLMVLAMFFVHPPIWAASNYIDTEILAGKISNSIQKFMGPDYKTLAISRIKKRSVNLNLNLNELIDYTNVKLVRTRRYKVTDRSKLQLLLKEQRMQLSEFVSPNEYKELGKILGVQVFIYGTLYNESLVLKAIDIQNSQIVWADVFPMESLSDNHDLLNDLSQQVIQSVRKEKLLMKEEKINRISFWNIDVVAPFMPEEVIDYMTTVFSREPDIGVIDRENLQLIFQEQKLNQAVFIDESQARRLGELYGVDSFLYGTINFRENGEYVASLKMMSVFTGVLLWADLIKFKVAPKAMKMEPVNPFARKIQERKSQRGNAGKMVLISGGSSVFGSNDPLYNASPERMVNLRSFMIDPYEVTNGDYFVFTSKTNHRMPSHWTEGNFDPASKDHPVVRISWEDAKLYCQFMQKRLPSEQEWERALRGTQGRKYPWNGSGFSPNFTNTREAEIGSSIPVYTSNRDVTPEGIYHLAGNVREFVADQFRSYDGSSVSSDQINDRVIRGSSWAFGAYEAVGYYRGHSRPNLAWPDVGFRCVKDL
ncbi:MAG: SUMF1/EgtB/PvdO family nonheme iron enzyme [SAR324 cluster bacterium]|nr:SUMF1/EgtB/PvdO family nonheme iron enzyme [SAR324 cluster bacterium]